MTSSEDMLMDELSESLIVTVLLSTFNGAQFLEKQFESLSNQDGVTVKVYVNDDGSTDGTMEILKRWKYKGLVSWVSESSRIGSSESFLKLLRSCNEEQFVAFCDQDDVWERDKLISQIQLCKTDVPTLVFSQRSYIDESGKVIGQSRNSEAVPSFANALVENIAPGNTILINTSAVRVLNRYVNPPVIHYDSWIYLVMSAFGECHNIKSNLVNYRLHGKNQVGLRKWKQINFEHSIIGFLDQARYFLDKSIDYLTDRQIETVSKLISVLHKRSKREKFCAVLSCKIERQFRIDKVGFKILALLMVSKGRI